MARLIRKKVEYEFTDEDFRKLAKKIKSPCCICGDNPATCMGCPKHSKYIEEVKALKADNLYDINQDMSTVEYYYDKAIVCINSIKDVISTIPNEVVENFEDLKKAKRLVEYYEKEDK